LDSLFSEAEIPKDILDNLIKYGNQVTYKPKDVIILQEQYLEELYFITSGLVKFSMFSIEGGEQTFFYLGKGFFFGEYPYISGGQKSNVTIEAGTKAQLLVFNQSIKSCLYDIEGFKKLLLRNMSLIANMTNDQVINISLDSSEQRIQKTLEAADRYFSILNKNNGYKITLTRKEIADLSGCSVETVNRYIKTILET